MATKTLLAREEYLRTGFESPEPEYVNGELVERSITNFDHAETQVLLTDAFRPWSDRKELFCASEIRFPIGAGKFRVADFALFLSRQKAIPEDTPYLIVEIVSTDDRHEDLMAKLADYEQMGVEFIFVAGPPLRKLSRYLRGDLLTVPAIELPAYGVDIPRTNIFA